MFICKQKINFILSVFLEILQRYCKLVILDTLNKPGYTQPKLYCPLVQIFCIYLQTKEQLHPTSFSGDIQTLLFWVLWVFLAMHNRNHKINLYKILMFLCIPKINFIIHFFLEILHFKESCSSIGQQHFTP